MKLKDLVEKYGEYEVAPFDYEEALKKLDNDDNIVSFCIGVLKKKQKTVWDLKNGNKCYYIGLFGDVEDTGGYLSPLSEAIDMGIVFLTEEDAEKDVERRKVETLLLKYGGRRWFKEDTPNYFIRVHENGLWLTSDWTNHSPIQGTIYFDTEKQAKKAVKEIGEERIKNALFEVR